MTSICFQFGSIPSLAFPGGAFSKVNKTFLEKQQSDFDAYLQTLLSPSLVSSHGGLQDLAFNFLEHRVWNQEKYPLDRKVSNHAYVCQTFAHTLCAFFMCHCPEFRKAFRCKMLSTYYLYLCVFWCHMSNVLVVSIGTLLLSTVCIHVFQCP